MLYAILCYAEEEAVQSWSREEDEKVMQKLASVQEKYAEAGRLGPVARLRPTSTATTLRKVKDTPLVLDGPFTETKEQLLGFYTIECDSLEEALAFAREISEVNPVRGCYEIRPVEVLNPVPATI